MKKALIYLCLAVASIFISSEVISYEEPSTLSPKAAIQIQIDEVQAGSVVRRRSTLDSRLPSVITEGFEVFKSNDFRTALNIWLEKSSPLLQNNVPLISRTLEGVVREAVGECTGYAAIDILSVTDNTQLVFVESQHEYGALFWAFTTYKSPKGWIISDFQFNTDPYEVIPISIIFRR